MNEHILTSSLAQEIMDLGLEEATNKFWPKGDEPRTYIRGCGPIDAVYHTPSLEITSVMQLSFHEGVGDHRTVLVDISSQSMIGKDTFCICRPPAHRLTMANKDCVTRYTSILEAKKLEEHSLPLRLAKCKERLAADPTNQFAIEQMECIDKEVTELQAYAERKCRKFR